MAEASEKFNRWMAKYEAIDNQLDGELTEDLKISAHLSELSEELSKVLRDMPYPWHRVGARMARVVDACMVYAHAHIAIVSHDMTVDDIEQVRQAHCAWNDGTLSQAEFKSTLLKILGSPASSGVASP